MIVKKGHSKTPFHLQYVQTVLTPLLQRKNHVSYIIHGNISQMHVI